jgi:gliding motility-associated-like protein
MSTLHKISGAIVLLLCHLGAAGQGLVQCGGHIVFDNGGHIVIDGTGDYYDTLNGQIDIQTDGNIWVPGHWINASTDKVFTTNDGQVTLTGAQQHIAGSTPTAFPTLELAGSDNKYLDISAIVGGGFSGGGTGQLICNNRSLLLNSQTLTINNRATNAVTQTGGGIVSETPATPGYGSVEWVVRNTTGSFVIPFRSASGIPIFYYFNIATAGVNAIDSGFVSVATYPTITSAAPNNRALPTGVNNSLNEFGIENAPRLIDRFWIVGTPDYSTKPFGVSRYGYIDDEWNGANSSTNTITENNLRPMRYNLSGNRWLYSRTGLDNASSNYSEGGGSDFEGIWTLADSTVCPSALFTWLGNCENSPISYTDRSTISSGTIDSWGWKFGDGVSAAIQHPIHTYSNAGVFSVFLKVVGSSGCPDSLELPVEIDVRAIADFSYDDDPLVDIPVNFTSLSQFATRWDWDFGDFNYDNIENPKHTFLSENTFDVILIANNLANCPDTIQKTIEVNLPSLFLVPSAFSPGTTDNLNTHFGLTTLQRVSEYKMVIYNRWGEQIFESDDITKQWDGSYLGKPVPAGSYLYLLSFRDRTMKGHYSNGTVLLVR